MATSSKCMLSLLLIGLSIGSVASISPWFTGTYTDMHLTFRRFSYCVPMLEPIKAHQADETNYLVKQITNFLDHADYDNDQMKDLNELLDQICVKNSPVYPISVYINTTLFGMSKSVRCQALEDALNYMYPIFKGAAMNKSERLSFSSIVFYPTNNETEFYNLTDLINTAWIQSNITTEQVCAITDSIKLYTFNKSNNLNNATRRDSQTSTSTLPSTSPDGIVHVLREMIESLLDRLYSLERMAVWESTTRLEQLTAGLGWGVGQTTSTVGKGLKGIRNIFWTPSSVKNAKLSNSSMPVKVTLEANVTQMPAKV